MPASTKKKRGSRPMWPDYRPQPQERTLALYDRGRIYTEDDKAFSCLAYNTLRNILFDENLLLFTDSFTAIPFLPFIDDIVQDFPNTQAHCTKKGDTTSISFQAGNKRRHISLVRNWGMEPSHFTLGA